LTDVYKEEENHVFVCLGNLNPFDLEYLEMYIKENITENWKNIDKVKVTIENEYYPNEFLNWESSLVVVGSGGPKPKEIMALQEDEKLTEENYFLRRVSAQITKRIKEKEICYINDYLDFSGDLEFQDDEW